jgi:hypothetical protein
MVAIEGTGGDLILEFDGGLSRDEADHAACTLVHKRYHRIEEPTKSNGNRRNER